MALKESILNLNKALRCTLQNVPSVVDTLIRGLKDVADAAEEVGSYSDEEKEIGTWTDGSKLYQRYIDFGSLPSNTMKSVKIAGIDIKEVSGSAFSGDYVIPLPYIYPAVEGAQVVGLYGTKDTVQPNKDIVRIITNSDRTGFTARVKVRYTKVGESRSPENDTKNGGDVEPDVKTVDEPVEATADELKK